MDAWRQQQELDEYQQWLADPVAQAEYQEWLRKTEGERLACEQPNVKELEHELIGF